MVPGQLTFHNGMEDRVQEDELAKTNVSHKWLDRRLLSDILLYDCLQGSLPERQCARSFFEPATIAASELTPKIVDGTTVILNSMRDSLRCRSKENGSDGYDR